MKNIVLTEEPTTAHDQCPITTTADHHMVNLLPVSCFLFLVSCFLFPVSYFEDVMVC